MGATAPPPTRRAQLTCCGAATNCSPTCPAGPGTRPDTSKHPPRRPRRPRPRPAARAEAIADLAERVELLGERAHPHDECRKLVAHLLNERDALFTFLARPGIDATNWRAEQAIRPAVVNRKVWGGNRTWRGAATQGRIMSVLHTAAQQGIDAVDYLARLARAPTPDTIPALLS